MPPDWDLLVPDSAIHEVLDKQDYGRGGTAGSFMRKLLEFCRRNRQAVWIGGSAGNVCAQKPKGDVSIATLVQVEGTRNLRRQLADPAFTSDGFVEIGRSSLAHREYERALKAFLETTETLRDHLASTNPDSPLACITDTEALAMIRDPYLLAPQVLPDWAAEHGLTMAQLHRFPDALPHARWLRLVCWYLVQRSRLPRGAARDLTFSNNYADADAVFMASYAGILVSSDYGQCQALKAIEPQAQAWKWSTEGRCLTRIA